jgi:hypothetical protein
MLGTGRLSVAATLAMTAPACNTSDLTPAICTPGDVRCTADGLTEVCNAIGTRWMPGACPAGQACVLETCDGANVFEPTCRAIVCEPGATRCNPGDQVRVETCDPSGTDWCCIGSCAQPPIDGVCFEGECGSVCSEGQKSYLGCEYFAVDLDNANVPCGVDENNRLIFCDAAAGPFAVVLSNPDPLNKVVYMVADGPPVADSSDDLCQELAHVVEAGVLPPNGIVVVELPRRDPPSLPDVNGTVKAKLAFRIATNAPVTAYQFNPLENVDVYSNDASLLMPTNTAGTDFYVMTREQTFDDLKGTVTVVGIEEGPTEVRVIPTAPTLAGPEYGVPALASGQPFVTTLERFEVLNIESDEIGSDFTGTKVTSNRGVIVFGGSEAANAPNTSRCDLTTNKCEWDGVTDCECTQAEGPGCNPHAKCSDFITCCADHLEQQLYPVTAWGTEYVCARSMPRGSEMDVWRVLASQPGTVVSLTPSVAEVPSLDAGEWFEFQTSEDFLLSASNPVLVGQFLAAEHAPIPDRQPGDAGTGDPAFILAVPTRQLRDTYVFLAPNKYEDDFVSIAAPAGTPVHLDGVEVTTMDPASSQLQVNDIAGTPWRALRVRINDGFHVLSCPSGCSVMVHGYDQYVSYGYPGGLNLEDDEP